MAWNDGLQGQGLEIASSDEGRIRVIAGPGSGKTFTLMRRIARLLESGIDPKKILLVTFTRTAAHDLKKELMKLGVPGVQEIKAGTLHSFCYGLLLRESVLQITGRNPRPLFKFELEFAKADLQKKANLGKKAISKKIKAFESAWARLQSDEPGWPQEDEDKMFQQVLINYLRFHKSMLIGEVIPEALKYLRNNPQADERKEFKHVFVDEFQDLNKAEQELISILAEKGDYMIIGDEDQSIYEIFRNSHPEGIRTFHLSHENTKDFPLTVCRRCPTDIVKAADSLIQNNLNRDKRNLVPREENPKGNIHSIQWPTLSDEREGIVQFITKRIKDGVSPGDILLMCPRREIGYELRDRLIENGIEAHSFFTEEMFESMNAQKSMTLLNLLINNYDRVALRCWLGFDSTTFNASGYSNLVELSIESKKEPFDVLKDVVEGKASFKYSSHSIEKFNELQQLLDEFSKYGVSEVIEKLFSKDEDWALQFNEMLVELNDENHKIKDIQKTILNSAINPEMPLDVDYVRIMSIHKSKGLTSEISIICSAIEGLLPQIDPDLEGEEAIRHLEEQRRLFFVGITRPKQELVVSTVSRIPKSLAYTMGVKVPFTQSQETKAIASSFLTQLGETFPNPISSNDWDY
ncbi:ATP-dependent helicase [Flavobacterium terrisoli]|uniref:ATP-dependent helicase n=1 Tax=Flavobacterium terrisoli TaxID=3242195 RepID=UPI002542C765|nr:ATP-dependent helicase [Flavobacterium buctense]